MPAENRQVITVSELNRDVRRILEAEFPMVYIEGEISNFARPASGHWYFTLKDDKAQVRCAMFRNRNHLVRFQPRDGQQVLVRARVSLYEGRGEFQLLAEFLEDGGEGALRRAFEKLRNALQQEGLFDEQAKKPVPAVPAHIAIITSPGGAAIRDVISVMKRRFPSVHLSILPVQVQGDESVPQIVRALDFANRYAEDPFDLILLTRGGGSLEDLWSFNTEPVARAIAASGLPVVSAVGHESDVTIADFVADLRAPTPSAAAELVTPDGRVWQDSMRYLAQRLNQGIQQKLEEDARELHHLSARLRHPSHRLAELNQRLDEAERRLLYAMTGQLSAARSKLDAVHLVSPQVRLEATRARLQQSLIYLKRLEAGYRQTLGSGVATLAARLQALSPLSTLQRGYAIVTSEDGSHVITSATEVEAGEQIRARLMNGELLAEVISKEPS